MGSDVNFLLEQYRAGVNFQIRPEDGETCLGISVDYGPVYGASTSVPTGMARLAARRAIRVAKMMDRLVFMAVLDSNWAGFRDQYHVPAPEKRAGEAALRPAAWPRCPGRLARKRGRSCRSADGCAGPERIGLVWALSTGTIFSKGGRKPSFRTVRESQELAS